MPRRKVVQTVEVQIMSPRLKREPRYVVIDMDSGAVGHLRERGGYVMGGGYVNPSWEPVFPWPDDEDYV